MKDRLPPHCFESEQGLLGCILLSPNDTMPAAIERLKHGADTFYDLRHQTLYAALQAQYDRNEPIDIITLQHRLKSEGTLEGVGGLAYLSALMDVVPSAANLPYYADAILEKFKLRRLLSTCTQAIAKVHEHFGEVDVLLDEVERDIMAIAQKHASETEKTSSAFVRECLDSLQLRQSGGMRGIATGFHDLDKLTSGLENGTMVVIAARPSCGKTSLAVNIMENAMEAGLQCGLFSLEMPGRSIIERMIASQARVNTFKAQSWNERDFAKVMAQSKRISKLPLRIDDRSGLTVRDIRLKARRWKRECDVRLIVIDYMQLVSPLDRTKSRQQQVGEISQGIKQLAKELEVPIIVLAQLNREIEKEKGRKPRMSDLRESGDIEQDADMIGFLYKLATEDGEVESAEGDTEVNLLIAKQRNGPAGQDVRLIFRKQFTRFENATSHND
jgi:replicative DNA helicase